jgi:hypothetical protein
MLATRAAKPRDAPRTATGTTLAPGTRMPPAKRRTTKPQSPRPPKPVPQQWRWDEVLDAALALEETDFLAVLSEMMMVRDEKVEAIRRRNAAEGLTSDIPFDDPLEDDPFDVVSPVTPLASRRARARKR